jgi:hypothetical protein
MSLWKIILVVVLGLICGVVFVAVFGLASGVVFYSGVFSVKSKDLQLTVLDEETGDPIPKATVSVSVNTHYFKPPPTIIALTDDKGIAKAQIAGGASEFNIGLQAKGYKKSTIYCSGTSAGLEFKLKKLPKVILNVPNDYVGPIKFDLPQHQSGVHKIDPPKEYQFHANAQGEVDCDNLEHPAHFDGLNESLHTGSLTAFYEDGREIPLAGAEGVKDSTIALRHVSTYYHPRNPQEFSPLPDRDVLSALDMNKPQEIYVIGTAQDEKALLDSLPGVERIGVDFDFDIHDYNWGKTKTGL